MLLDYQYPGYWYPRKLNACDVTYHVTLVTSELSSSSCVVALTWEMPSLTYLTSHDKDDIYVDMYKDRHQ